MKTYVRCDEVKLTAYTEEFTFATPCVGFDNTDTSRVPAATLGVLVKRDNQWGNPQPGKFYRLVLEEVSAEEATAHDRRVLEKK